LPPPSQVHRPDAANGPAEGLFSHGSDASHPLQLPCDSIGLPRAPARLQRSGIDEHPAYPACPVPGRSCRLRHGRPRFRRTCGQVERRAQGPFQGRWRDHPRGEAGSR